MSVGKQNKQEYSCLKRKKNDDIAELYSKKSFENLEYNNYLDRYYIKYNKKNNLIIKFKTIKTHKGFELIKKINECEDLLKYDKALCEVYNYKDNTPIKLFLDIDLKFNKNEDINKLINKRKQIHLDFKKDWYVIDFSRRNKNGLKISFHMIHKKIAFSDYIGLKNFVEKNIVYDGVDLMYKSYFCLRCPGQSKYIENKDNKSIIRNGTLLNSLITGGFEGYMIYDYIGDDEVLDIDKGDISYDEHTIWQLLDILPSKYYDDYNIWVKICYALKNFKSEKSYDMFIRFSKKSSKFGNGLEANKLWLAPMRDDVKKITCKSIFYYAKLENEVKFYEIINPNNNKEKFMSQKGLTYQEFTKKWNNSSIKNTKDFISDIQQVMGYYDKGISTYIFKNKNEIFLSKTHNLKNYKIFLNDKKYSFWDIVNINNITSIQYDDIQFYPGKIEDRNIFNLWSGFKSTPLKNNDLIKPILHHIRYVWANNIEERFKYIIKWLANIIQIPDKKNGVVLVFIGNQGCGKNILCNFLMKDLIGKKYTATIKDLKKVSGKFNSILEHKLLITLDEVSNIEKNYHRTFDKLKNLITEDTQQIERKGIDPITIDDYCNYIMLSNNYYPVKVEGMDRRYCIFECSNKYIGNTNYFKKLNESFNQKTADAFMYFLTKIDISNFNLQEIPHSNLRSELMNRSIPEEVIFLKELIDKDINREVSIEFIWSEYVNYCNESFIKPKKKRSFFMIISRYIKNKRIRRNGKRERFYIMDPIYFKDKVKNIKGFIL
jgi:hypothetical protein